MPRIPDGARPSTRDPKINQRVFNWESDAFLQRKPTTFVVSVTVSVQKWANYMMGSALLDEDIAFDPPFDSKDDDDGDLEY